jgi:hypothetical protein
MSKRPYRTENQREVMGFILEAAGRGVFLSVTDIHGHVAYRVTYGAVRKSLKSLMQNGMLVGERRGQFVFMLPTQRGYDWFRPKVL